MNDPSSTRREEDLIAARFPAESAPGQLLVLRILWGAFIATQGVFAGVHAITAGDVSGQDPADAAEMLPVFIGLALVMASASLFAAPIYAARAKIDFLTVSLIRFALAEAIGLFGLILGFQGLELYPYAFLAASTLVILVQMPSETAYQRYRKDCLSGVR